MNKKQTALLIAFNILAILIISSFVTQLHNIDTVFNSIKENSTKCDYINTEECIDLRDLYVNSFRNIRFLFFCVIILLLISFNVLIINSSGAKK